MIGDRIQEVRRFRGETQQQLADALHLSVHSVRAWEQNKSSIGIDSLIAICKHYDVSADYLLELIDIDPGMAKIQREKLTPENRIAVRRFEEYLLDRQSNRR